MREVERGGGEEGGGHMALSEFYDNNTCRYNTQEVNKVII